MPDIGITQRTGRIAVSTITFRFRPFEEALALIASLGAEEIDLGALPGVCDHVPVPFTGDPAAVAAQVAGHGLRATGLNADVGALNDPALSDEAIRATAAPLIALSVATGADLILPAGGQSHEPFVSEDADHALIVARLRMLSELAAQSGVRLLVEVLHHRRFAWTAKRADRILDELDDDVIGLLLDTSHVVASDEDVVAWAAKHAARVRRVHLRDAVPGNLNLGLGRGAVDFRGVFTALEAGGYSGAYVLELETHDVEEDEREADAARSIVFSDEILAGVRS